MYQLNLDFIPAGQMLSTYAFRCPGILQPVEIGARGALFIMEDRKWSRSLCVFFRSLKEAAAQRGSAATRSSPA